VIIEAPRHEHVMEGVKVQLHTLSTLTLYAGEWSASRPRRITPGEWRLGVPKSKLIKKISELTVLNVQDDD